MRTIVRYVAALLIVAAIALTNTAPASATVQLVGPPRCCV